MGLISCPHGSAVNGLALMFYHHFEGGLDNARRRIGNDAYFSYAPGSGSSSSLSPSFVIAYRRRHHHFLEGEARERWLSKQSRCGSFEVRFASSELTCWLHGEDFPTGNAFHRPTGPGDLSQYTPVI